MLEALWAQIKKIEFLILGVFAGIEPATLGPIVPRSDQLS